MKKKMNIGPLHKLEFAANMPQVVDLAERAAQTIQVQRAIGDIVAGLLANQEPLIMNISLEEQKKLAGDDGQPLRSIAVTLYWRQVEDDQMHAFKDVMLAKRCLDCAGIHGDDEECQISTPSQSQQKSDEGEA